MMLCTKRCLRCVYGADNNRLITCDYMIMTGQARSRHCAAGKDCMFFMPRYLRKKGNVIADISAFRDAAALPVFAEDMFL